MNNSLGNTTGDLHEPQHKYRIYWLDLAMNKKVGHLPSISIEESTCTTS